MLFGDGNLLGVVDSLEAQDTGELDLAPFCEKKK